MSKHEKFDLIISMGGNCAAASQCVFRKIRMFSLPFDYTFMADTQPIDYFANNLKNEFQDILKKENLVELREDERGDAREQYQYKDIISGYRYIHLFNDDINKKEVYKKGYDKIHKRVKRLFKKISQAHKILVICATNFEFDQKHMQNVKKSFEKLYPNKEFVFYTLMFNAHADTEIQAGNMHFIYSVRAINLYDYDKTNFEWKFLDNVKISDRLSDQNKFFYTKKIKKGILHFFRRINTILYIKLYLFGMRIQIIIGKNREE